MKFEFFGGANEVGRSCIKVDGRFLLDSGLKITEEGSEYPLIHDCIDIEAVFLSHAHLDHTGALPLLNKKGLSCPIFCNLMTKETSKILLKDSYKIELINKQFPIYTKENLYSILGYMNIIKNENIYDFKDIKFSFHYSAHIPGSAYVFLEINDKKILYTGDFNTLDTKLLKASKPNFSNIDYMICETTYGDRNHPNRKEEEKKFLDKISKTLKNGGNVLIPAFAVGRAQEIILILASRNFKVPIYLDGMAKKVSNLYKNKSEYISNHEKYCKSLSNVKYVKSWKEREQIAKTQSIIITTSGMLDGGPVIDYLKYFFHNSKNSILLTGYQGDGTNGKLLVDEGRVFIDGNRIKVQCNLEKFDFSAHAGKNEIIELIKKANPKNLFLQHGDREALKSIEDEFKDKCNVIIPNNGDFYDL
ncbi:MAG: MBL fold metallo-hydrolase [Candidatus Woesearchaeota archaeon]